MKHIKGINEYKRTVGFRYSEPFLNYKIGLSISNTGVLKVDDISEFLKSIRVKFDNISVFSDGMLIDISVYNKYEIDSIITDLIDFLIDSYGVSVDKDVFVRKS